jgi:hypothetical protein
MQNLINFAKIHYLSSSNVSIEDPEFNFVSFLCLDTKKQKSRAAKNACGSSECEISSATLN